MAPRRRCSGCSPTPSVWPIHARRCAACPRACAASCCATMAGPIGQRSAATSPGCAARGASPCRSPATRVSPGRWALACICVAAGARPAERPAVSPPARRIHFPRYCGRGGAVPRWCFSRRAFRPTAIPARRLWARFAGRPSRGRARPQESRGCWPWAACPAAVPARCRGSAPVPAPSGHWLRKIVTRTPHCFGIAMAAGRGRLREREHSLHNPFRFGRPLCSDGRGPDP